jgi:hypothetical protein
MSGPRPVGPSVAGRLARYSLYILLGTVLCAPATDVSACGHLFSSLGHVFDDREISMVG